MGFILAYLIWCELAAKKLEAQGQVPLCPSLQRPLSEKGQLVAVAQPLPGTAQDSGSQ